MAKAQVTSPHKGQAFWDSKDSPETERYNTDWMKDVPDNLPISNLSIPGTNDSMASLTREGGNKWIWSQSWDVSQQLKVGIRYLDIRLHPDKDTLYCNHGDFYLDCTFTDVLNDVNAFLRDNGSETVLMRVKKEFADDIADKTFQGLVEDNIQSSGMTNVWHEASWPKMGDVRGTIVIIADYSTTQPFPAWGTCSVAEDTTFPGTDKKWINVKGNLDKAHDCTDDTMFATVTGSRSTPPGKLANVVNQKLYKYVKEGTDAIGIVAMDYPGPHLVQRIIQRNKRVDYVTAPSQKGGNATSIEHETNQTSLDPNILLSTKEGKGEIAKEKETSDVQSPETQADLSETFGLLFALSDIGGHMDETTHLTAVIAAMKKQPMVESIQTAGLACLVHILETNPADNITNEHRSEVMTVVMDSIDHHMDNSAKNGVLALYHLKITQDELMANERIVSVLHRVLEPSQSDGTAKLVAVVLLNLLSIQGDGQSKSLLGRLGTIKKMIQLIANKLESKDSDNILQMAWSALWNVTDETPSNSEQFLDEDGLRLFLSCHDQFPDERELLNHMVGLFGNIAEVEHLRHRLMQSECLKRISKMLESSRYGFDTSCNVCGVLAHLISDGEACWTVTEPTRENILTSMANAISGWNIKTSRNISYRSLKPFLKLLSSETDVCQHWAVWALYNLSYVHRETYCPMLALEGGLTLLHNLVENPQSSSDLKTLAVQIIDRCGRYQEDPAYRSAEEEEEEEEGEEEAEEEDGEEEEEEEQEEDDASKLEMKERKTEKKNEEDEEAEEEDESEEEGDPE